MQSMVTHTIKIILIIISISLHINIKAQNNWSDLSNDRKAAVDTDSLTQKGYTLIWINKDQDFNMLLKKELMDNYFKNYPKLAKEYNPKTRKKVYFIIDPDYKGVAATDGGVVRYNPEWFRKNPFDIDVVTHEVMHIVQDYPNDSGPWWITEGIADYVRYVYGVANGKANWKLPEYNSKQNFDNSYRVTARFLSWIEHHVKKGFVKKLNLAMREKTYTPQFWKNNTGKTVEELWTAYGEKPSIQ